MKKKFMMAAVLLGALTLGSCVDDNESASVTAIREQRFAKQKQHSLVHWLIISKHKQTLK